MGREVPHGVGNRRIDTTLLGVGRWPIGNYALISGNHVMVPDEQFLPPIGFVKPVGAPLPDEEIRRIVVAMCEQGGQHQPPSDLADEVLSRLRSAEQPREVAEWLRSQLEARSAGAGWWITVLLNDS